MSIEISDIFRLRLTRLEFALDNLLIEKGFRLEYDKNDILILTDGQEKISFAEFLEEHELLGP
jgi:hypothetical protein